MKLWRNTTRRSLGVGPEQRRTDRLRESEADCAADQRAEQIRDFGRPAARVSTPHDQNAERRRRAAELTARLELKGPASGRPRR